MKQIIFTAILISAFCFAAFAQATENACSKITIISSNERLVPFEPAAFTSNIANETEKLNFEYVWTTSSGEIIKGQGTSKIELMVTKENYGENVTISVKVNGLPENCANTSSNIVPVIPAPNFEPFFDYGKISQNEERAVIDNLSLAISRNENYDGVIIFKFGKETSVNKRIERLKKIIEWIKFRKLINLNRITFMISEEDTEETIVLVLPPNDSLLEELSKDYKSVKAEEFEQKINEIFPKK